MILPVDPNDRNQVERELQVLKKVRRHEKLFLKFSLSFSVVLARVLFISSGVSLQMTR